MSTNNETVDNLNKEKDHKNYELEYSNSSPIEKAQFFTRMTVNTLNFYLNIIPNLFISPNFGRLLYPNHLNMYEKVNWNESNQGLIVVIHGLLGSPKTLGYEISKKVSKKLLDTNKNFELIIPKIPHKGNCSLECASEGLYHVILDYINNNQGKNVYIVAGSNGCRIASFIECKLRNVDVKIKLTCVVGAYNGSKFVDMFKFLLQPILSEDIIRDLSTESEVNTNLKTMMCSDFSVGMRFYEFYVTANDFYIPNFNDCAPKLPETERLKVKYHPLEYEYDHVSLAYYISDQIIETVFEFLS